MMRGMKMDSNLLNDRLGRLKEWEQSSSINELLFNALSSFNIYVNERFDALAQEIRSEGMLNPEPPVVKIAVCAEEDVKKQLYLHPVSTEPPINCPGYITTVFTEADYPTIQEMMGRTYTADLKGKTGTGRVQVSLRYSLKYLQKLKSLYYVFNENEIPWITVNGIYLYKFLDVFCEGDVDREIGGLNGIKGFGIDFLQYDKYVSYDKVPLWNVSKMTVPVASCEAKPAYNAIQYEHTLKNIQFSENQYLVCHIGDKFNCFRRGQMMYVRTYAKQLEQIELLRITGNNDAEIPLQLPPKSNQKKDGFIKALARGRYIPTRGEAERIIHSLNLEPDLRFADVKVIPRTADSVSKYKSVDFNYFIETNAFMPDRKLLLFTFVSGGDKTWAFEIMFYALSELQLYFYEYHCVGELI
jgi:hypothetical protein